MLCLWSLYQGTCPLYCWAGNEYLLQPASNVARHDTAGHGAAFYMGKLSHRIPGFVRDS